VIMTDKAEKITPRLKTKYTEEVHPALRKEFKHGNVMEVGRIVKVVVNMGVGEAAHDSKMIEGAVRDLAAITGQKPQVTRARKSIAQFKLREGQPIGAHATLRGPIFLVVSRPRRVLSLLHRSYHHPLPSQLCHRQKS